MTNTGEPVDKVITSEGTITLPTYELLGENRNPVFHSQYGVAHIYPYTLLDDIAPGPTDRTYRTLHLENRYLRITVLPDLGGRVYSVYDKTSQREVFYKNDVVKFSPLAIRGAFFAGGMEFSFPVAHAPTTADPVNWAMREEADGSASIAIGGLEHMSGMRWTITLTLYPNRCALAQDVRLYNPSTLPGRYHYWTNASLISEEGTEFVYPLRRVRSYEFAGTTSWPVARLDLVIEQPGLPGMEGVPMWPAERMPEPFDFRWEKDVLAQVSIFGRDVEWDFFGIWQHRADAGYAHFAPCRDVSGMKLWSWGKSEVGVVNQTALIDDGSRYAETQCGAMETQLDFALLPPGGVRGWREWWLPLRGLSGLTCASERAGARLHLSQDGDSKVTLTVGVCPVSPVEEATVTLSIPGATLLEAHTPISPERPWLATTTVEGRALADHPITLSVLDGAGGTLLSYTHERETSPIYPDERPASGEPESADDYYVLGLHHENFDNRAEALDAYREALTRTEGHGPAHFRLGLMLLRAADFEGAAGHLSRAADLNVQDAHLYLGLLSWYQHQAEGARGHFDAVPPGSEAWAAARRGLGGIALSRGDWGQAVEFFAAARAQEEGGTSGALLLGLALRRAGQVDQAQTELESVLAADPLNHVARREMATLEAVEDGPHAAALRRMLADDRQYALDLACHYLDAGLAEDALAVLEEAAEGWAYPMLDYLAAYVCRSLGQEDEAGAWLARAAESKPDLVFPSRLWEVEVLRGAIDQNPGDARAKYYLGNFLYAHERYEEGIRLWEESLEALADYDVIYRNLGLAYWQQRGDLERAADFFEKGLALNPHNQDFYMRLDDLYKAQGRQDKREELLAAIRTLDRVREDVRKRTLVMLADLGRYEEALQDLTSETFVPLEMDQSFHQVYVKALMARADDHLAAGRVEEAAAAYREALAFPENLGVGRPTTMAQAEVLYRLGCAYEQMGRFAEALDAWRRAACEHHPFGDALFPFVQMALDKLSRYGELGFVG
jgi:tetratricopeptide (TPR) repeat protein